MKKSIKLILIGIAVIILLLGYLAYGVLLKPVVKNPNDTFFYIDHNDNYDSLKAKLKAEGMLSSDAYFDLLAEKMNLKNRVISGKYHLEDGWSLLTLIRHLRNGKWENQVIKIKAEMDRDSLILYLSEQLEPSAEEIKTALLSKWKEDEGFTKENVWCIFLPDHYFFNWSTSAEGIVERFFNEYKKYWTDGRLAMAYKLDLSPEEVCILATIADGEAIHTDELSRISGLYLNRLERNMPLQSDPTAMFVDGKLQRRRALNADIDKVHSYNTYHITGLPPGPIMFADKRAIEGVLHAEDHNYIFMCAIGDGSFRHNFATNIRDHNKNVALYRKNRRN